MSFDFVSAPAGGKPYKIKKYYKTANENETAPIATIDDDALRKIFYNMKKCKDRESFCVTKKDYSKFCKEATHKFRCYLEQNSEDKIRFDDAGRVRVLRLIGINLSSLPKELWQLTALNTLDISDNDLTSVPKELGQLAALKTLGIDENQLTSVPKELRQQFTGMVF